MKGFSTILIVLVAYQSQQQQQQGGGGAVMSALKISIGTTLQSFHRCLANSIRHFVFTNAESEHIGLHH
jgi:hypothetical protein